MHLSSYLCRAVVSGGAGGTLAPLEFGCHVNPIPTRGGRLCPPHYCKHPRIRKPKDTSVIAPPSNPVPPALTGEKLFPSKI